MSAPPDQALQTVGIGRGTSSARVRVRLFMGRMSTAARRSPGVRSVARVGLRFAQLHDISAEPGDNGECAEVDLFKEFGFYVDPARDR
jgi:hypothetical protein